MKKLRLLLVDDNPNDRTLTLRELKKEFEITVEEIIDAKGLKSALDEFEFDFVITDYKLGWSDGLEILHNIKKQYPYCPVIMYTGTGTEEVAVEAMKAGLDDYVLKSPKHFMRLPAAVKSVLERAHEREERMRAENALRESEAKYRTLFEASPDGVMLIGLDGVLLDCNDVVARMSGISKNELIGKSFMELSMFDEEQRAKLVEIFPMAVKGEFFGTIELVIQANGTQNWLEASPALLKKDNEIYALQLLVRDVTERKHTEEEMKKRLMKFKLENGKNYLVKEPSPAMSVEAFRDLLKVGYRGLIISRTPVRDFMKIDMGNETEFLWLAEHADEKNIRPNLKGLELKIENMFKNLARKNVILVERLDYLIFKNGFRKTLSFVQRVRELAYLTGNIVIMSIDPSTLNRQKLRWLEKEGWNIEPRMDKNKLPEELLKTLKGIYQNNIIGVKPSYTSICQELGISKPTVRKRVRSLTSAGYVMEVTKGRNKVVELTETGKNLFFD